MRGNVYLYIAVMALVTYAVRALPLTMIRRKITSRYTVFSVLRSLCHAGGHDLSGDPLFHGKHGDGGRRICGGAAAGL